jgi:hypothetical protein
MPADRSLDIDSFADIEQLNLALAKLGPPFLGPAIR